MMYRFVMLIDSPVFTRVRLQLLSPGRYPDLMRAMYSLLMLCPQSNSFNTLHARLSSVPTLALLKLNDSSDVYAGGEGETVVVGEPALPAEVVLPWREMLQVCLRFSAACLTGIATPVCDAMCSGCLPRLCLPSNVCRDCVYRAMSAERKLLVHTILSCPSLAHQLTNQHVSMMQTFRVKQEKLILHHEEHEKLPWPSQANDSATAFMRDTGSPSSLNGTACPVPIPNNTLPVMAPRRASTSPQQ
jgi:hypothetical protein